MKCFICGGTCTAEEFAKASAKYPSHKLAEGVLCCGDCMDEIDAGFQETDLALCQAQLIEANAKFIQDWNLAAFATVVVEAMNRAEELDSSRQSTTAG